MTMPGQKKHGTFLMKLKKREKFDQLTGIYNKRTFFEKTREMMDAHPDVRYEIVRLDVERFKVINELFGREEGNSVLRFIAAEIAANLGLRGTYGRIGSDVFGLCFPYREESFELLRACNAASIQKYKIDFEVVVGYGIYLVDEPKLPVNVMFDRAGLALQTIKGNYVQRFAFYEDSIRQTMLLEQRIVNEMNQALEQQQFEVYFQPIYQLASGELYGAEALVRWRHPKYGLVSPGDFVPVFERNGFIMKLDLYIWEKVCQHICQWREAGKDSRRVTVNVSRVHLYQPRFCQDMLALLNRYGLSPDCLNLEIIENAYRDNPAQLLATVNELKQHGFFVLMDDFGSGYSSLNMLKDIPVDMLKIDMDFLRDFKRFERGGNIIAAIVRLAKWLKMSLIAEGVETKEQVDYLRSIGCDNAQGYYFSEPLPAGQYAALLDAVKFTAADDLDEPAGPLNFDFLWNTEAPINILLNNMLTAIGAYELKGEVLEVLSVNDGYYEMMDCSPQVLHIAEPVNLMDKIAAADRSRLLAACHKASVTRQVEAVNCRRLKADGTQLQLHIKLRCIEDSGSRAIYYFVINDITAEPVTLLP